MSTQRRPVSGAQYRIATDGYEAWIASVGATLRSLTHGDGVSARDLIVPFDENELRPSSRGAVLAPWPNRIVDGRYAFEGTSYQLPLTEPARGHAIHGFVRWQEFTPEDVAADRIVLTATIEPQTGYPFRVEVRVAYALTADGLTVRTTGRNLSPVPVPWGSASHPYVRVDDGVVDDWTLTLDASQVMQTEGDRLIPAGTVPVDTRPELDFRRARRIANAALDHAFTGFSRRDGWAAVEVRSATGTGVEVSWDEAMPWGQVYTSDGDASPTGHRRGLAVEPMTCPPDAFNSGIDLVVLAPDAEHAATWRLRAI